MNNKKSSTNKMKGSLDQDTDILSVNDENYIYALNITPTQATGTYDKITNISGNTIVPFALPFGNNKVIGQVVDKKMNTIIYMVWNSQNNHSILRYYSDTNSIQFVAQYDFKWEDKPITNINLVAGHLLYWTDFVPRKIDVDLANNTGKKFKWNLVVTDKFFALNAFNGTGQSQSHIFNAGTTIDDVFAYLNANNTFSNFFRSLFTYQLCNGALEIEQLTPQNGGNLTTLGGAIFISQNFYPVITDNLIDAGKATQNIPPRVTLKYDPLAVSNNLKDKLPWQFRTRYVYDNYERSVLSPYSDIAVDSCGRDYNYIIIDYTANILNNPDTIGLIKQVEIYAREGNEAIAGSTIGKDKLIKIIDQNELWLQSQTIGLNTFNFYNDGVYSVLDDAKSFQQYDSIPIRPTDEQYSISQTFASNRLMYGNFVENYEQPCDNSTVTAEFVPLEYRVFRLDLVVRVGCSSQFFAGGYSTGTGRIGAIINLGPTSLDPPVPSISMFGGCSNKNIGAPDQTDIMGTAADQWLPENGWPIYIANTDYFAISSQLQNTGLAYNTDGSIKAENDTQKDSIKNWYDTYNSQTQTGDMLSKASLIGIPIGRHVIRFASHLCSFEDKMQRGPMYDLNNGRSYQQTSTYMWGFFNPDSPSYDQIGDYEIEVFIDAQGNYEISAPGYGVTRTGVASADGEIFLGEAIVRDLTNPQFNYQYERGKAPKNQFNTINGYLYDGNFLNPTNNGLPSDIKKGRAIEAQIVQLLNADSAYLLQNQTAYDYTDVDYGCTTDHNGFFYFRNFYESVAIRAIGANGNFIKTVLDNFLIGNLNNLIAGTTYNNTVKVGPADNYWGVKNKTTPSSNDRFGICNTIVLYNTNVAWHQNYRTRISGQVQNTDGSVVPGVICLYQRTGFGDTTDGNGDFNIVCYARAFKGTLIGLLWNTNQFIGWQQQKPIQQYTSTEPVGNVIDNLILNSGITCLTLGATNYALELLLEINYFVTQYTDLLPYKPAFLNPVVASNVPAHLDKYLKMGGVYGLAMMPIDRINRRCAIVVKPQLKLPFWTENVQKYYPYLASQQAIGAVKFTLNLVDKPEIWETERYFLRTTNQRQQNFLQFPAFDIKYVISYDTTAASTTNPAETVIQETTYETRQANRIWIGIPKSILAYNRFKTGSNKSWTFSEGDRLIFKNNFDGAYFAEYINVSVLGTSPDLNYFIIESQDRFPQLEKGAVFEIYSPNFNDIQTELYYEFPVVVPVLDAGTPNRRFATTTVDLNTGDTYRRGRIVPIFEGVNTSLIEDVAVSDFYPSTVQDIGRFNIDDNTFGQLFRTNTVRYSEKFINNTKLNGLSDFQGLSEITTPMDFGALNKLILTSDAPSDPGGMSNRQVMLAIHVNKAASIYIGEVVFSDTAGSATVSTSDKVLGSIRMLKGDYGTVNPESVVAYDGLVFWWDAIRGKTVQYAQDGLTAVQDYKMISAGERWKSQYGGQRAFGMIDPYNYTYYLTLGDRQKETVGFNYAKNGWQSYYSFTPENYSYIGTTLVSFRSGELWLHNSNVFNNFYGTQYSSQVRVVSNLAELTLKLFFNFREVASGKWWMPEITTVPNASYPTGMLSRLKPDNMSLKEGDIWGSFLKDINDPAFTGQPPINALLKGRNLRGECLVMTLQNDSTALAWIRSIQVFVSPSENTI